MSAVQSGVCRQDSLPLPRVSATGRLLPICFQLAPLQLQAAVSSRTHACMLKCGTVNEVVSVAPSTSGLYPPPSPRLATGNTTVCHTQEKKAAEEAAARAKGEQEVEKAKAAAAVSPTSVWHRPLVCLHWHGPSADNCHCRVVPLFCAPCRRMRPTQ